MNCVARDWKGRTDDRNETIVRPGQHASCKARVRAFRATPFGTSVRCRYSSSGMVLVSGEIICFVVRGSIESDGHL